jgi:hypothetical protein
MLSEYIGKSTLGIMIKQLGVMDEVTPSQA